MLRKLALICGCSNDVAFIYQTDLIPTKSPLNSVVIHDNYFILISLWVITVGFLFGWMCHCDVTLQLHQNVNYCFVDINIFEIILIFLMFFASTYAPCISLPTCRGCNHTFQNIKVNYETNKYFKIKLSEYSLT